MPVAFGKRRFISARLYSSAQIAQEAARHVNETMRAYEARSFQRTVRAGAAAVVAYVLVVREREEGY